jgi:hypothetical protein
VQADKGAVSGSTDPVVVGQEAHIVAEEDDGPRGDLSERLINDPMAPWSWGGARLVPWRVC